MQFKLSITIRICQKKHFAKSGTFLRSEIDTFVVGQYGENYLSRQVFPEVPNLHHNGDKYLLSR